MLPFEFIKSELKNFIIEFPKTRVRYEMDDNSSTHSIEVVPNEIYRLDKNYIIWEDNFFDEFINQFPDQSICFISDDAIVGLDKIDFELSGREYISMIPNNIIDNGLQVQPNCIKSSNNKISINGLSFNSGVSKIPVDLFSLIQNNKNKSTPINLKQTFLNNGSIDAIPNYSLAA
ncbi:hypothetical protein [Flavobacterium restrictum]|uniref:Uncharacterized protein n=1 Tax=Flavobacterium restrictum TaxID=2594428 RepID=A0A553EDE7_9FLAO|nr:hypothetical protein [Flavobacterium restrictum]TRX43049.1 hypothetical protein FNW21_01565 [Flavobacterium restrictum]